MTEAEEADVDAACHVVSTDFGTKMQILDAMDLVMDTTPLKDLTVTAICRQAGIARQTFYRHFIDKFQVIQWYWDTLAERNLRPTGRTLTWYESNLGMFTDLEERQRFWCHALKENEHYCSCGAHGRRRRREFLVETITVYRGMEVTEELQFEIDFLLEAESRLIAYWILSGMRISPEQFALLIERCIPRALYTLLATPVAESVRPLDRRAHPAIGSFYGFESCGALTDVSGISAVG